MALLTADWDPYGNNSYFRKFEFYQMDWSSQVDIDNAVIIASKFGGPIAVIRDRVKAVRMDLNGIGKPVIAIYSASGRFISSFVWSSGHLVQIGWSSNEDLLCIQENGEVIMYNIFGKYVSAFRMGQEVEDTKVISAHIFYTNIGTGICVLTGAYRIYLTNSIKEPKVRKLSELPGIFEVPNSWAVIYEERSTYVLFARGTDMYYVSDSHVTYMDINKAGEERGSIITDIAVSCNYEHVALYSSQEQLWIGSTDLRKNYRLYDMHGFGRPKQLTWCGSEAVVGYWDDTIIVVGKTDDSLTYAYYSSVVLCSEIDCIRVISSFSTDIIQPVPSVLLDIYRLDSTSPGSYLLEASKQFEKKSHRANEYMHLVKEKLHYAVQQCVEGAGHEFVSENQKMLLKAAYFGQTFLDDYNSDFYVKMGRVLRILNAVRELNIGILVTYPQFERIGLTTVIDRLILRRHYYIAIQIANYMRLNNEDGSSRILEHWACYKVAQLQIDREQVAKDIADKLGTNSGVSYIDIAKYAIKNGRYKLAVKLIDYEPQASLQVSMLLDLEKYELALEKAVDSGNTDLINIVVLNMHRKMSLKDFQLEIRKNATVYSLYKKYCRLRNKEALLNIYRQEDDHNEIAACSIRNSYSPENLSTKSTLLETAKESYKKAKNDTNMILCAEQKKLLQKQKELEDTFPREFIDLSLHDTIYKLLIMGELKIAEELRHIFKVTDRRYWWLRIESLSELGEWTELERFSRIKKSPFGFEPFLDVCLKHDKKFEAMKYIGKVKEENKIKYLVKLGSYRIAIELAENQKDVNALKYIQANCDVSSKLEVTSALARLGYRNK